MLGEYRVSYWNPNPVLVIFAASQYLHTHYTLVPLAIPNFLSLKMHLNLGAFGVTLFTPSERSSTDAKDFDSLAKTLSAEAAAHTTILGVLQNRLTRIKAGKMGEMHIYFAICHLIFL